MPDSCMSAQRILALVKPGEATFLEDYFSDTCSSFNAFTPKDDLFRSLNPAPGFLFFDPSQISPSNRKILRGLADAGKTRLFIFDGENSTETDLSGAFPIALPLNPMTFEDVIFKSVEFPPEMRVLVVDDEPELCAGIREYLESRRSQPAFRVEDALNGLEAFHKMEAFRPDVTILDLKMPVKSGHDFYREAQKRFSGFRAIVLTSSVGPEEIEEIRKSGAPPFVEKGSRRSSFPELVSLIKKTWIFS